MSERKNVYVMGAGGFGKLAVRALQDTGYDVAAVFDDQPEQRGPALLGSPVVGPLDRIRDYPRLPAVIAIGNNVARKAIAERFDLEWITVVSQGAYVDRYARVGVGTIILRGAIIHVDAVIGDHVFLGTSTSVSEDASVGSFAFFGPGTRAAGGSRVGEGAFLGVGVSLIPKVSVGAWTTVGAGGAVVRDLPPHVVAVGLPARVIKQKSNSCRDSE